MPELPEVETVRKTLKEQVCHKTIIDTMIYHKPIIEFPCIADFRKQIKNQTIQDIVRRGKWLMFELDDFYLLSHLRMEGKYFLRDENTSRLDHEHVCFYFGDHTSLRYYDTRKFGRMHLVKKEDLYKQKPLSELGYEPWDSHLTSTYLKKCYQKKTLPIKTVLLDQSIFVGLGNIYADEVLFLSKLNPYIPANKLTNYDLKQMIENSKVVLDKAIQLGGTTIRSYTSSEGVHGRFQNELLVHGKEYCPICETKITKEKIGGRGTYYCPNCQKNKENIL